MSGTTSISILQAKSQLWERSQVQELCESRGGRPGLSVLTSLLASVDVKLYWTMLRHWSQLVPNISTDIWGLLSITSSSSLMTLVRQKSDSLFFFSAAVKHTCLSDLIWLLFIYMFFKVKNTRLFPFRVYDLIWLLFIYVLFFVLSLSLLPLPWYNCFRGGGGGGVGVGFSI